MKPLRLLVAAALLACAVTAPAASAGIGGSIPPEDLGSARGLNYISVSYSPFGPGIDLFAVCDETAAVLGGGVHVTGPPEDSNVAYGYPGDDNSAEDPDTVPDDWWVGAARNLGSDELRITTYGICRKAGRQGLSYVSDIENDVPVGDTAEIDVKCPAAKTVVAGGADLYRGPTTVSEPFDSSDGDERPNDGWQVRVRNEEGTAFDITVWAVCLNAEPDDVSYRSESGETGPEASKTLRVGCPTGTAVTGGGWDIKGPPATRFVHSTRPKDSGADGDTIPDDRWSLTAVNNGGSAAKTTAHAICLR